MQCFIQLQNTLTDPLKSYEDFEFELCHSEISQFTYICLLLNLAVTIKRENFSFERYFKLLTNYRKERWDPSSCINYTGYKGIFSFYQDKISILMNASEKSVSSTVALIANHPNINLHALDPNGLNAVFYAIKNPDENEGLKILEILNKLSPEMVNIEKIEINTVINNGYSPLFLAVERYRLKIIDFLLRNNLEPNHRLISTGNTALHELLKKTTKNNLEETRKIIEIFLKYDFDFSIRNNHGKTLEDYSLDMCLNITDFIKEIKPEKSIRSTRSEFECQSTETEAQSSKIVHFKIEDGIALHNYFEQEENEFCHYEINTISLSSISLLSEEINHFKETEQRELSLDMNLNEKEQDDESSSLKPDLKEKKMQCHSHSDSKNEDFELENTILDSENYSANNKEIESSSSSSEDEDEGDFRQTEIVDFMKISKEISEFYEISQKTYFSAMESIKPFLNKLCEITGPLSLQIEIIGSFATGLWTNSSDIDISLVSETENYVDFEKILEKVFNNLKFRMFSMGIKQLSYNWASKIPGIKLEIDEVTYRSKKIDIMIFHKKNMGKNYVCYIKKVLSTFQEIGPIFYYLKKICEKFGLYDPFHGGMKSYSIFLMIFEIVKSSNNLTLGEILLKISLYYGFYHQYDYEIEYKKNKHSAFKCAPIPRLNIYDPLNTKNNMGGKNTDAYKLQNMFRVIYYGIHRKITKTTTLQFILELSEIFL